MTRPDVGVMREAIHAWIRDDVPLGMKMMIRPEHVTALAERLEATRSTGTGRSEAEAMKAACLAVVREVRKNYRPVLTKSRYQAREIQQFFGGACGLIDEDISALDPTALNPPAREGEGDHA
jgi:hypothetical protein